MEYLIRETTTTAVERIKETNIVAISWRGAVKDGKDEEYIVEFCRKQASYYLSISTTY